MSRPDNKGDSQLGKTVLDEPKTKQSDPTVLDLQLRAIAKQPNVKPVVSYMCKCRVCACVCVCVCVCVRVRVSDVQ